MKQNIMKTGTTTIGILCKDGILLAADKRMTAGGYILGTKLCDKIHNLTDKMALTEAGLASDAQLIIKIVKAQVKLMELKRGKDVSVKEAANMLSGIVYNNIRRMSMIPGISHFILGGIDEDGFSLFDIFADGTLSLCDEYISSGSGSVMAYGVLETLYQKNMTINDAVSVAIKALNAAIQRDTASGSGFDIIAITKDGVKKIMEKEISTKISV